MRTLKFILPATFVFFVSCQNNNGSANGQSDAEKAKQDSVSKQQQKQKADSLKKLNLSIICKG